MRYFKDEKYYDQNNYPIKVYRVEQQKMLIEILDQHNIQGAARYFPSVQSRDLFINEEKDHLKEINILELKEIQQYWKNINS